MVACGGEQVSLDTLAWVLAQDEVTAWQMGDDWYGFPGWGDEAEEHEAAEMFYPMCLDRARDYKEALDQ